MSGASATSQPRILSLPSLTALPARKVFPALVAPIGLPSPAPLPARWMARTISSPGAPSSDALNCFSSPAPPPKQHAPQPHRHLLYLSQAAPVDDPASASTAMQHDQHHAAAGSDDDDDASRRAANHAALAAADADADSATTRTGGGGTRKIVLKRPPSSTSGPSAAGSGGARSNGTDVGDAGTDAKGETDDDDDDEDTHVELGRSLDAREPDGEDEDEHDDGDDQSMKDPTVASSDDGESEIEVASRPPAPPPASNARRPRRRSSSRHADAWAGTDDDDDDSGADDKAVDTVTFAQPGASLRVSRSGRISKPPAHVLQSVQSLAFLDDEQDDDEQPQQRPKGKSKGKACVQPSCFRSAPLPGRPCASGGERLHLARRTTRLTRSPPDPCPTLPLPMPAPAHPRAYTPFLAPLCPSQVRRQLHLEERGPARVGGRCRRAQRRPARAARAPEPGQVGRPAAVVEPTSAVDASAVGLPARAGAHPVGPQAAGNRAKDHHHCQPARFAFDRTGHRP